MPVGVLSISDGARTTVNDLIGAPMLIPARILDLLSNHFITDTIFRDAGPNANGLVEYHESNPLYLGQDVETVAEFAEIPVAAGQLGLPRIAYALKKALGIRISREMRDENKMQFVALQLTQLVNTIRRADDRALRAALMDPRIPTIAATLAWTDPNAQVRRDIANAAFQVGLARPAASQQDDVFGYVADTLVLPNSVVPVLQASDNFNRIYVNSPLVSEAISYTGRLPQKVLGLDTLLSWSWPNDRALVVERKTLGFYSDTRPLEATGLYGEGNGPNGGPTESWRSDVSHKRAMGADQPLAACWITGVNAP